MHLGEIKVSLSSLLQIYFALKLHFVKFQEIQKLQKHTFLIGTDYEYLNSLHHYCIGNLDAALSNLEAALEDDPNHDRSKMLQSQLECLTAKKIDGNISHYFD